MFNNFLIIVSLILFCAPNLNASTQQSGSLSKILNKQVKTDTSKKSKSGSLKNILQEKSQNRTTPSQTNNNKPKNYPNTSETNQVNNKNLEETSNTLYIIIGVLAFIVILLVMRKGGSTKQTNEVVIDPENTDKDASKDRSNEDAEKEVQAEKRKLAAEKDQKEKEIKEYHDSKIKIDDDEFTGTKKVTMELRDFSGHHLSDKYNDKWPYSLWVFMLVKVDKKFTLHTVLTTDNWWFVDDKNSLSIITDSMGTISLSTIRNDRNTIKSGVQEYMIYELTKEQLMAIRDTKGVIKARFTCNNHGNNYDNFWNWPNPETVDQKTIEKLDLHSYYADNSIEDIGGHTSLITMQDCIRYFLDNYGEENKKDQLEKPLEEVNLKNDDNGPISNNQNDLKNESESSSEIGSDKIEKEEDFETPSLINNDENILVKDMKDFYKMTLSYVDPSLDHSIIVYYDGGPEFPDFDEDTDCNVLKFETVEDFIKWADIPSNIPENISESNFYKTMINANRFWQIAEGELVLEWNGVDLDAGGAIKIWPMEEVIVHPITKENALKSELIVSKNSALPSLRKFFGNSVD